MYPKFLLLLRPYPFRTLAIIMAMRALVAAVTPNCFLKLPSQEIFLLPGPLLFFSTLPCKNSSLQAVFDWISHNMA